MVAAALNVICCVAFGLAVGWLRTIRLCFQGNHLSLLQGLTSDTLRVLDAAQNRLVSLQGIHVRHMATCSSLQLPIYSLGGLTVVLYATNTYIHTHTHTQVPELKILDVSSNFLVDAQPQPWAGLSKLEELDVSDNSLSKVGGLATLTSLTRLHINRNQLQDLVSAPTTKLVRYRGSEP